jgi:hypothetical protein
MTASTTDLRPLIEHDGPFLTLLLPAPSHHADAAHRFEIQRKNALKAVSDQWSEGQLQDLETTIAALPHDAGAAVIVIYTPDGPVLVEFMENPVEAALAFEGALPRLAPLIEARQRTISHIVVHVDLAGADLVAFDGGSVVATNNVEGDTEHIHRGHPGGWSQRRYQQRAENTWDSNVGNVADAVMSLVAQTDARLIAIVGPTRAQSMLADALADCCDIDVVSIDAGDPDGGADEIVRMTADVAATETKQIIDQARESMSVQELDDAEQVLDALREGRVQTLLVHDDEDDDFDKGQRILDVCIKQALLTGADIHVVPNVSILSSGVAAITRW